MGCVKSKRGGGAGASAQGKGKGSSADGASGRAVGEEAYLVDPRNSAGNAGPPPATAALLAYAQRLSEEIVCRAVQQWADVDRRYGDIPYIECDVP